MKDRQLAPSPPSVAPSHTQLSSSVLLKRFRNFQITSGSEHP